jgi:hypothetical protein
MKNPSRPLSDGEVHELGEEQGLLDAAKFMDAGECRTLIAAARDRAGRTPLEICDALDRAGAEFTKGAAQRFRRKGEW